ncbi:uncharacterized protein LMH87_008794 [Akanthomyces muscarius]|uniref:Uncharacterized protein n=1 Tax=Akanthomyces muscarius TaxID=2231603 RepID=A0A9W8QHY7_AKAMU|nr:uncharacterized protein LMH87_008794 [Akanthomyces muscarius]KAJ4158261.1 hypothetical protein LMH87_008794 [Akanthomyces muscarius]
MGSWNVTLQTARVPTYSTAIQASSKKGQAPAQLSSHHARPFCFTYSLSASTILDGSFHIVAPQRLCFADSFQVPCLLPISSAQTDTTPQPREAVITNKASLAQSLPSRGRAPPTCWALVPCKARNVAIRNSTNRIRGTTR